MKAAEVMIVSDEEHLGPASGALDVGGDEAQDVVVPHQHRLVDLRLSEPARLGTSDMIIDNCVTQLMLYTGDKLSSTIFCL